LDPAKPAVPNYQRDIAKIDPGFRNELRRIVTGEAPWPLLLYGPAGTGKTCAALCLLDYAGGRYFTMNSLCAELIDSQQGRLYSESSCIDGTYVESRRIYPQTFWERIEREKLVVLDEIGANELVSDHHYDAIHRILEVRKNRPFVAISNLPPEQIERLYDGRIFSRLACGTVVHLQGCDRRLAG
jgi:DNA replication protein DnaC